jgi:hypothetical protein
MSPSLARLSVQILSGVIAFVAALMFRQAYIHFSHEDWAGLAFVLLLAVYSAAVVVWSLTKLSPKAIGHLFGLIAFWLFMVGRTILRQIPVQRTVTDVLSIMLLVFVIWSARRVWRYFIKRIYGDSAI